MNSRLSNKERLYRLICAHPYISQQELAAQLQLSRSAVAGYIASLTREQRLLGRAYVLPDRRPVVCIGGANIDRKLRTLAPLQLGSSNPVSQHETYGGVARNIAENLARLGLPVGLLCALGDDAPGQALLAQAQALGIAAQASLQLAGAASGSYTALLDDGGQLVLALAHMDICEALTPAYLRSRQPQRAQAALTVADLNLPAASIALLLAEASAASPLVLVAVSQPKMARLPAQLQGLRLLILNRGELEQRAGHPLDSTDEIAAACRELQGQGVQDLIVTLGAGGVLYSDASAASGMRQLAAPAAAVRDVTGAGDAFAAGVCWSLYRAGDDLALACRRGLRLAALTLQCEATVCPTLSPTTLIEE